MTEPDETRASFAQAKAVVNRLFKFRARSEKEIRQKLNEKGFPESVIDRTVEFYKNCEMINDTVFAKAWIGSRLNKPFGIRRIKQELKEKGVADEIIAKEWAQKRTDYDEIEAVKTIIQRRWKTYAGLDPAKAKRRMEGYLLRRGFSQGTIYKMLNLPK